MDLGSRMARALKPTTYTIRYPRKMTGNPLLYISSASASLGDALLGYSQGITAAFRVQRSFIHRIYGKKVTYKQIKHDRTGVRGLQPALLIGCLSVTALFSALASAYASDFLGRRASIRIGAILADSPSSGPGAGILSTTVPVYQVEIAPAGARGMLVGIEALCMNAGYAASAWVGYAFYMDAHAEHAWRGPFGVQATVSLVLFIWTFFLPESLRWLIQNGFYAEGLWTLADLHARRDVTDEGVTHTYDAIVQMLEMEEKEKRGNRDGDGAVAPSSGKHKVAG
ncbi:hypothetical protein B0H13DRAFT_2301051 [Mycena leptocephala]|nr:hypothetical protein B0H13DRAFT_2301051 [Mycena leptocephala]